MDGISDILGNLGGLLGGGSGGNLMDQLGGLLGGDSGGSLLDKLGGLLGGGDNSDGGLLDQLGGLLGGDNSDGGLLDKLKDLIPSGDDAGDSSGASTPDTDPSTAQPTPGADAGTVPATPADTPDAGSQSGTDTPATDTPATEEPGWHINPPTNTTGDPNQPVTLPPMHIDPETGLQVVDPLIGGSEPGDAGDQADLAQGAYPDYILELPERVPEDPASGDAEAATSPGEAINAAVQQRLLFESQQINEDLM